MYNRSSSSSSNSKHKTNKWSWAHINHHPSMFYIIRWNNMVVCIYKTQMTAQFSGWCHLTRHESTSSQHRKYGGDAFDNSPIETTSFSPTTTTTTTEIKPPHHSHLTKIHPSHTVYYVHKYIYTYIYCSVNTHKTGRALSAWRKRSLMFFFSFFFLCVVFVVVCIMYTPLPPFYHHIIPSSISSFRPLFVCYPSVYSQE